LARTAAQAKLTLVIYMGMSGAAQLQDALLQGLGAHTPVAVVQHVSLPAQRHVVCTLGSLHETVVREGMGSPSVIVVGDVFKGMLKMQATHAAAALQASR
jgi:uroporphyrin-III C-methyltransferase